MKKTLIAMSVLLSSVSCFADEGNTTTKAEASQAVTANTQAPIELDKQYIVLPTNPSPDKEVIEFFSFNCPSCFKFEAQNQGPQTISKALPEGVKFKRYHLENFGPLAKDLAQAWAVANVLGVQDKVSDALYNAIQKEKTVKTADDIKAVFEKLGVSGDVFDKTKDSFLVKAFMVQQTEAIKEMKPESIPTVVVNRKFYIVPNALDMTSDDTFINDYARVTAFVAGLDPNVKMVKKAGSDKK
ncbi:thioredoxin domain-containing protein [Gilliamella sp. Pra-s65]|uniref:DsbA family protein n=1 Tax=unclassified Gilliamella TaxID=2685620 RepID=UPI0013660B49|nr:MULTISPECIES: DsbA family protein [unclassified Gilliamella]MWN91054.1 thioredoxin domain-containing protein [Gilliamella sp. Pra-s65]MWP73987.1 thioredoxin domain-containing protein [Gilliamella sp. Pra-s52]